MFILYGTLNVKDRMWLSKENMIEVAYSLEINVIT